MGREDRAPKSSRVFERLEREQKMRYTNARGMAAAKDQMEILREGQLRRQGTSERRPNINN